MTPTPALSYQPLDAAPPRPPTNVALTFGLAAVVGVLHYLAALIVPHYEPVYRNFGTKLPRMTVLWVDVSRWMTHDHGWAYLWTAVFVLPILISRILPPPPNPAHREQITLMLSIGLVTMTALISHMALCAPFVTLLTSISAGPPRGG